MTGTHTGNPVERQKNGQKEKMEILHAYGGGGMPDFPAAYDTG